MFALIRRVRPCRTFWRWFLTHQSEIELFIDSDVPDMGIYRALLTEIRRCSDLIMPELSKSPERYHILFTTEGMSDGKDAVERLVQHAPELEGWSLTKFRQPCDSFEILHGDQWLDERAFYLEPDGKELRVLVNCDAQLADPKHCARKAVMNILGEEFLIKHKLALSITADTNLSFTPESPSEQRKRIYDHLNIMPS